MPMAERGKCYDWHELDVRRLMFELSNMSGLSEHKVFCERPSSYGMLAASAFSYGYNFSLLSKCLESIFENIEYINPQQWTKPLHEGLDKNLKAKVRSEFAFDKYFPGYEFINPTTGKKIPKVDQVGLKDAALIAEFGRRKLNSVC